MNDGLGFLVAWAFPLTIAILVGFFTSVSRLGRIARALEKIADKKPPTPPPTYLQ